jgi:hypothetical protein
MGNRLPPKWAKQEKADLMAIAATGVPLIQIGQQMVAKGWPARGRRPWGFMIRELGGSMKGLIDEGEPLSPEDADRLRRYAVAEKTDEEICSLLLRPAAEVRRLAESLGLVLFVGERRYVGRKIVDPRSVPDLPQPMRDHEGNRLHRVLWRNRDLEARGRRAANAERVRQAMAARVARGPR